jgi:hypothetical protein
MLDVLSREVKLTARVLASIPDEGREYRPHPKSRSAWELAWHVVADVWFLDGIAELRRPTWFTIGGNSPAICSKVPSIDGASADEPQRSQGRS